MDTPKIQSIHPLDGKKLDVRFVNGIEKVYDCSQLLDMPNFQPIRNDTFFKTVKVDPGGYGISWNDELDLSEYELWVNGQEISTAG